MHRESSLSQQWGHGGGPRITWFSHKNTAIQQRPDLPLNPPSLTSPGMDWNTLLGSSVGHLGELPVPGTAATWCLPGETFWFAALQHAAMPPQKLRAVNTAWATKLRQPQSLCYGWVTRKQHFDEQSSSRTIFKAFLKTVPEPDLFPQESQRFERGEIPLCARTWVWKQL